MYNICNFIILLYDYTVLYSCVLYSTVMYSMWYRYSTPMYRYSTIQGGVTLCCTLFVLYVPCTVTDPLI